MKLFALSIFFILPAMAGQSGQLILRARVPGIYSVEITSSGSIVTHNNYAGRAPRPKIVQSERNGIRLVTVTHP